MSVAGTKEDVDDELAWLEKNVRRTGRQGEFKSDAYYVVRKLILGPGARDFIDDIARTIGRDSLIVKSAGQQPTSIHSLISQRKTVNLEYHMI